MNVRQLWFFLIRILFVKIGFLIVAAIIVLGEKYILIPLEVSKDVRLVYALITIPLLTWASIFLSWRLANWAEFRKYEDKKDGST